MTLPKFIDEPVMVQARIRPDDTFEPTAFLWRERAVTIADWGREWQNETDGVAWNCYLVRDVRGETFELRYSRAESRWLLARVWLATEG
jgi:hypothetical protein